MQLYILLTAACASVVSEITKDIESHVVVINSGPVRGYKDPQEDVFVFYGIPYATAPTDTERFKAPLPPPVWVDIFEAVDEGIVCPQIKIFDFLYKSKKIKENCLIANVYVPKTDVKNLPVVVYVHGGAFILGFGDFITPKKLVSSEKIIAVTFNYRLGAHGFLCLGTEDIPGNAGMKDQIALLRWVKNNISNFGGNPNDVTIAGYSAGAASVDLLMISKSAKGLFSKVIPESGSSLSPFSIQIDPIANAKEYAKLIGIKNVDDILELEKYFKEMSYEAPLPPPVWVDIFEAVDEGIVCPQIKIFDFLYKSKKIKENCLIANVYVPKTDVKNLPVVVYVHGGAFILGFGDFITPKKLVSSEKIIAVTFNYRLGAHGFLCLGTEDIPGNAGMKDQIALLRWVKNNISNFGGNPNDVTIAGYSAGAASVDLLMISKSAKGLFSKVIPESGSSLSPFSIQIDPIANAKEYAKLIGIKNVDDILELEKYFKEMSYEVLQSENLLNRKDGTFLFAPCVERDNGQEIFLEDNPVNILKQGNFPKLPLLYGFANMEGLIRMPNFRIWKKEMNENFAMFLPADLHFKNNEEKDLAANSIRKFYFGDKSIDDDTIIEYIDYMSDIMFTCPALRVVDHLVKAGHSAIYLYQYSYTDEHTPFVPNTHIRGADHVSQTDAILDGFDISISKKYLISDDFKKMKSIMSELWGNFIVNGKPISSGTPAWPPVGKNWSPHMDLKKNPALMGSLLKERCLFWTNIYNLHYKFPMPPSISQPQHREL